MTRHVTIISLALFFLSIFSSAAIADTFSLSFDSPAEVVMADPEAIIPVKVTNNGPSKSIRTITFNIDTAKYSFSSSTQPPTGWCISTISADSISFALVQGSGACSNGNTASRIDPGESVFFNITVLPIAAASDSTDSFSSVSVSSEGGFTLSGALPTWTRRSLEAALSAAPSSTGVGGSITLQMQVTNRSTATQTGVGSSPEPPSPSLPIAARTEGPYYAATLLSSSLSDSASTVNVSSTSDFPSSGILRVGTEDICYSNKTATSFTGATRGCNSTTAAAHSSGSLVYSTDQFSLLPGQTKVITWIYSADSNGNVYFTSRAANSSGTAKSASVSSNTVVIGDFTASLAITPSSVISGQQITAEMTVANNGTGALINIVPSSLSQCAGGATENLVSGPTPALISSLSAGSSGVFVWTYQITGAVGQTYCLSGDASANGSVATNTATSNAGVISNYSVTVAPSVVSSGSTDKTITWAVHNGGGCSIRDVEIAIPAPWSCSSVSAPAGWSGSCGATAPFSSGGSGSDIGSGSTGSFSITFSSTETVSSDKDVSFPVSVLPRGCGGATTTLGSYVTVSANTIVLSHSPAGPVYADGSSYYTMTATLTSGGSPLAGKTVTFSTTNGSLSASSAVTDGSGEASVTLTSPNSTTDTTATVTANYMNAQDTELVNFSGWAGANIQYWGGLTATTGGVPAATADCGQKYSFKLRVKNLSSTTDMNLTKSSYFAFNDSASGGTAVFQAYLDSNTSVPGNTETEVTFGSPTSSGGGGDVTLSTAFIAGTYMPLVNQTPPPASGLFLTDGTNSQWRSVTDSVTVTGSCGVVRVRIIEWHEMR
ncbi:MAG: hypothetical protein A2V21_301340 [Deltaproteobacteria bacterium GWC2_55_46]|nr:MAG: hypothetical protein A2Z79_09870 [Deltaproteobacteria bacterium GWA2_55_82]OGQ62493.1 MAG: hypothetical protein A3I81_08405 [Deltaproteobacteria bacterium RIFCSPLOWO2_02_FULL_55_12]OIJ73020.1 MAG: hypothetical protein A2V21_301340 [Deltaproteobacteria bacterium GWC2_55_46]